MTTGTDSHTRPFNRKKVKPANPRRFQNNLWGKSITELDGKLHVNVPETVKGNAAPVILKLSENYSNVEKVDGVIKYKEDMMFDIVLKDFNYEANGYEFDLEELKVKFWIKTGTDIQ